MTDEARLPLPSEDTGDLVEEPVSGMTDDYLVAREEGIPYDPPTERVIGGQRADGSGPDVAAAGSTDEERLEADDTMQATGMTPRDEALLADVLAALRTSDLPAGERIRVAVEGTTAIVRGSVESITIGDEILALVGDVPGVDDVRDELEISGV